MHFVGIGGAGMSGIARILLARGVRGLRQRPRATPRRCSRCARSAPGSRSGTTPAHLGDADTVVVSTAIRPDNPSWPPPASAGLRVLHRAEALAAVMAGRRSIAVAGTHGKTSTTSMLTVAVQHCGVDPSFAIGGDLNESGSNAHAGEGDIFVAEADESDGSFLLLAPFGGDRHQRRGRPPRPLRRPGRGRGGLRPVPRHRRRRRASSSSAPTTPAPPGCRDGADARRRLRTYGRGRGRRPAADRPAASRADGTSYTAVLDGRAARPGRASRCPGEHMALNSAAALLAGLELGLPAAGLIEGLGRFGGVRRRFELKGVAAGVRVYDDYAHHPTEVAAQLRAARAVAGERPAGRGLPAAPVQPDAGVRRGLRRGARRWPTRSWSWTSTAPARTRCPA